MSREPSVLSYEEFIDDDYPKPAKWWVRSAMGDYYFFHCRERSSAQEQCDDYFGKGRYKVNTSTMSKSSDSQSAVGRINSKSRAGMRK